MYCRGPRYAPRVRRVSSRESRKSFPPPYPLRQCLPSMRSSGPSAAKGAAGSKSSSRCHSALRRYSIWMTSRLSTMGLRGHRDWCVACVPHEQATEASPCGPNSLSPSVQSIGLYVCTHSIRRLSPLYPACCAAVCPRDWDSIGPYVVYTACPKWDSVGPTARLADTTSPAASLSRVLVGKEAGEPVTSSLRSHNIERARGARGDPRGKLAYM